MAARLPLDLALDIIPSLPRPLLARMVARMIERLDELDGDPDLEPNGDEQDCSGGEDDRHPSLDRLRGHAPDDRSRTMTREGRERPYRTCPADFRQTYIRMGWDGIMEHYATNWRVVARWIDETGRTELREARAAYIREHGRRPLHSAR
ncbi:hypothetical protein [Sphingopyxis sp. H050]|uniref:hypothetical protein n=1 Tax=Sphingopyxis sp. H050 TaxID=1759072 RepID=UPI000AFD9EF9|nr:hypothetical protein [Sphingopyxis sp. H050]